MTVPYTFGTATTSIPLSNLDANFNTPITLGNTSIYLGNTTTTIGNLTLTNVTISSGSANISSSYTTANAVVYTNSSNVGITSSSLKFDGTNLGIGVTPSVWNSGYKVLQFSNSGAVFGATGDVYLGNNVYANSSDTNTYITTNFASMYRQIDGKHLWYTTASGTAGNPITFTQAMSLDGNSGITTFNGTNASGSYIQVQNSGSTTTYLGSWLRLIGSGAADDSVVYTNGAKLGFNVAGTVKGTFTSTGLGIGTTDPNAPLAVRGDLGTSVGAVMRLRGTNTTARTTRLQFEDYAGIYSDAVIDFKIPTAASAASALFQLGIGGPTITMDANGNVGVNTISPSSYVSGLAVAGSTANSGDIALVKTNSGTGNQGGQALRFFNYGPAGVGRTTGVVLGSIYFTASQPSSGSIQDAGAIQCLSESQNGTSTASQLTFSTVSGSALVKAMTIDSAQNICMVGSDITNLGTTNKGFFVRADGGANVYAQIASTGTGAQSAVVFYNGNGAVGSISTSGSLTSYNVTSDYRLKENIAPMTGALAKVAQLKPVTYKWKVNGSDGQGFIAHELAEVVPDCVTGEKDAIDEDGNPKYQAMDTSHLIATLVSAIQELKAEVDALKIKIKA